MTTQTTNKNIKDNLQKKLDALKPKAKKSLKEFTDAERICQDKRITHHGILEQISNLKDRLYFLEVSPPEIGAFRAYKKCYDTIGRQAIVTLEIPRTAKRYINKNESTEKCRASSARVISIELRSGKKIKEARSRWDRSFKYTVGKIARPRKKFARSGTCASGIHFYMHRKDAVNH